MEFVHQYRTHFVLPDGTRYVARVYTDREPGGLWEAWFVFFPLAGGPALATDRETTQSKREDVDFWASGITPTYLEGALTRAVDRLPEVRLARRAARAEAKLYQGAAAEALAQARAAEAEIRAARASLGDATGRSR